jgi:Undecaprenyl-phosphate glucose phosphotransferase
MTDGASALDRNVTNAGYATDAATEAQSVIALDNIAADSSGIAQHAPLSTRSRLSALLIRIAVTEFVMVSCVAYAASLFYNGLVLTRWPPVGEYGPAALLIAVLVLTATLGLRHFEGIQIQPLHRLLWNGIAAVALAFSVFLSTMFLLKLADIYSRGTFIVQFVVVGIAVLGTRAIWFGRLRSAVASGLIEARRAVLIGDLRFNAPVIGRLKEAGIQIVNSFAFALACGTQDKNACNDQNVREIIEKCRALRPDDLIVAAGDGDLANVPALVYHLSELPVSVHVVPLAITDLIATGRVGALGGLATIQVLHPPLSTFDQILKRAFDIVAAIIGLVMFAPLFIFAALAIGLESRGPVFFRQTRHGYNNDTIRIFKFRTMTTIEDGHQCRQATKSDSRITLVGRVLRHTNVDELPQLMNVLIGEMSIVGPRPHPIALNEAFKNQISPLSRRHNVKPGITGWAQVNGYRGETDTLEKMQRRFQHDLYYIENWSLLLDLKIIMMTLFSKKAYSNAC